MNEKDIIKLSLVISVIGIMIIYGMALILEPPLVKIVDITKDMSGEQVKVCGEITSKYKSDKGTLFLKIKDIKELSVVFFKENAEGLNAYDLESGEEICVEGNIEIYKNELEIIGDKFEKK